jgi:hypothetical protein
MSRAVRNVVKVVAFVAAVYTGNWQIALTIANSEYGKHSQRKANRRARDAYNASLEDNSILAQGTDIERSRVYGRKRNTDALLFQGTHGADSRYLTWVVALAGHECDSVEGLFLDETFLSVANGGLLSDGAGGYWVTQAPWASTTRHTANAAFTTSGGAGSVALASTPVSGSVVVTRSFVVGDQPTEASQDFTLVGSTVSVSGVPTDDGEIRVTYQWDEVSYKARVWMHTGAPGQNLSSFLAGRFPSLIGPGDRFEGMAIAICEWEYSQDAFPSGPPNVSGLLRGAKVLDIRTAVTAWTQNPALIARDWAIDANGGAALASEIDDDMVIAAANACDVSTDFETASGTVTLPLYQCGISCKLSAPPDETMGEIVESMAGKWGWSGGTLALVAGVYRAPVATITQSWDSGQGDIETVAQTADADLINSCRATIADAAQGYKVVPLPAVTVEAYVEADGQELPREISMSGVNHAVHAQHISGVLMRDQRAGETLRIPCNMRAWGLKLFDTVAVDLPYFGISGQAYEVQGWEHGLGGPVTLTLKRTSADIFDPDELFALVLASVNDSLPLPWSVTSMSGLVAESGTEHLYRQADGSILTRVWVTWDAISDISVTQSGRIEVRYGSPGEAVDDWQTIEVMGDATGAYLTGVQDGAVLVISARAVNTLRVRGQWATQIEHTVVGKTERPADVSTMTVVEQPSLGRSYFWDYPSPPVDLQGFEVRYSAGLTEYAWDAMVPLFEASKLERSRSASVPGDGEWTFAIRAVDTTGNMSLTPSYVSALFDQGSFGFPITSISAEALGWPGDKVNAAVSGYVLGDIGELTWDTIPDTWDAWLTWDGPSTGEIVYTHPEVDLGASIDVRIRASHVAAGSTVTEYQSSDDDVTYTTWDSIPADPITARYVRVRWTVTGSSPALYRAGFTLYA